jgi:hydroxypyruvate isomerase
MWESIVMIRYAANLAWLFTEYPFLERFRHASQSGFRAVEVPFPYDVPPGDIAARKGAAGIEIILINTPPGDADVGEFGRLGNPEKRDAFRRDLERGLDYANRLGCHLLHTMVGKIVPGLDPRAQRECIVENLSWALPAAQDAGVKLLIEAINPVDIEDYFLTRSSDALSIVRELASDRVAFEYDVYHMQRVEGNLIQTIRDNIDQIGHIQIADVPGRHQPGTGEINYLNVLRAIDAAGYRGHVGLEYRPLGPTEQSFGWVELFADPNLKLW